jgi:hypothetical protein
MAGRQQGPLCSSRVGADWIDGGTSCRHQSSPSRPLGMLMSLFMAAAPQKSASPSKARSKALADLRGAMFHASIEAIEASPFGKTSEGAQIVELLYSLNAAVRIQYEAAASAEDDDATAERGSWDGQIIRVDKSFENSWHKTAVELVHEASHALWRGKHPIAKNASKEARLQNNVDDEFHAQENQLEMYKYLKSEKGMREDALLETRLRRQAGGTLRSTIETRFRGE